MSPLLKQPYAEISRRDWFVGLIWSLALRGNFWGRKLDFDKFGFPQQIKPIHPDAVQIWRDRDTGRLIYRYYGEVVPLEQVFHVRYQLPPGEIIGLNPIQVLSLTFGNAVATSRFVESYYLNGAAPLGVIQVPGYLDRTETRKMMRGWVAAHQGLNKANLPAILTEGAEFKPITISPSDSQLIEALKFSDSQIAGRIFRVPPHLIGILERVSGLRGIEQLERSFFANTLVGYLQIAMEAMTGCHRTGQFVHFDTSQRTRGATLERAQAGALVMNSGVARADEIRDWFDWPALPGGDGQYSFAPINTQLLAQAVLTLKQQAAMPSPTSNGNGNGNGNGTGKGRTVSGAQPKDGMPQRPSSLPTRKPSPNGLPRDRSTSNGHEMGVDEALEIVEAALDQQRRMEFAADLATRLGSDEED